MENETMAKSSKKLNETDKYSTPTPIKAIGNKQKLKCNLSKMVKSGVQIRDMNKKNNIANSNTNLKSKLCMQTKTKLHRCAKIKSKTQKVIKIIINVTYNNLYEKNNADAMRESEHSIYPDLSFLDDFDVDEIVDSLLSCKNSKENINKGIQFQGDIDNSLIKSSPLLTKENIMKDDKSNLKLTKTVNTKYNFKDMKNEVQHIQRDVDIKKLDKICHASDRSLDKVINKIKANDQEKYKKEVKILHLQSNNEIERKANLKESELCYMKPDNNQIIDNNTIYTEESSKGFSNDSNNFKVKEESDAVNIKEEKINYECSLNEYHTKELLSRNLEIKISALLTKKYLINTVAYYGKFSKIFKCTEMVTGKIYTIKMLNECELYKGEAKKQMLLEVQDEIPMENLCCIFLMNSFLIDRHWCFMTYYYPTNLEQVLQNKSKSFHIDEIRKLSMQLVLALIALRNKNIVHSDIKPSHILLNSELKELKLCGFDEAYYYYNTNYSQANIGSVNYSAPEIILGYSNSFSIDIWSMALVMYEMVTKNMLFSGKSNNEILYKQMTTFGNLPCDMITQSRFGKDHFVGISFVRNGYCEKENCNIKDFRNNRSLQEMIMDAYKKHWGEINTKNEIVKLNSLCQLLKKMFMLNPKRRLPIEYVYANNFFLPK